MDRNSDEIHRADLDGSNASLYFDVTNAGSNDPYGIALDKINNYIYWTDFISGEVYRGRLSGGMLPGASLIHSTSIGNASGIDVDPRVTNKMYFANDYEGGIDRVDLDGANPQMSYILAATFEFNVVVDGLSNKIYWTVDDPNGQIRKADLSDGSNEVPVTGILTGTLVIDLAIDLLNSKLYYITNTGGVGAIHEANLDGTGDVTIIPGLSDQLRSIDVDPNNGKVYWSEAGIAPGIWRANLDGSSPQQIVPLLAGADPKSIVLDTRLENPPKIYWTENVGSGLGGDDEIHRVGFDGSDFEIVYSGFSAEISGIEIDEPNSLLYWTDAARAEIFVSQIDGHELGSIVKLIDYDPSGTNGLFDLALDVPNNLMYYTHGNADNAPTNAIVSTDFTAPTPQSTIVNLIDLGTEEPFGIDLDLTSVPNKIYFTTNEDSGPANTARLRRMNLDGSGIEELYSVTTGGVSAKVYFRDVKVDETNGVVHWAGGAIDAINGFIMRNSISDPVPFAAPNQFIFPGEPRGIDLDLINNRVFWVCRGANVGANPVMIMSAEFDGTNTQLIHQVFKFPGGYPGTSPPGSAFMALDLRGLAPTPLKLTGATPSANAINVAISSNLTFNFDQNVDGATVNSTNILITGDQTGQVSGSFSGGGTNTITFNPTNDFKAGELIQVSMTTNVLSISGGALINKHFQSFMIASDPALQNPAFFVQRPVFSNGLNVGVDRVVAMDVNKDGNMDLASIYDGIEGGIAWYQNDGSQGFTRQIVLNSTFSDPRSVAAADLDLDGDIDLLSAFNGALNWYENDGSFSFTQIFINQVGIGHGIPDMRIADINGDGYLDIVTIFASGIGNLHRIVFYENSGSQSFTRTMFESTINIPQNLELVDMDEDGDVDIVAAGVSGEVGWYENDGNLNFSPHTFTNSLTSQYEGLAVGDLNGDGHVDMAVTTTTQIVWMENDGTGNFTEQIINLSSGNNDLHAADIDGDGDLDLVGGAIGFRYYENDGVGNFTIRTTSTSVNIQDVFPADVDSDGDMDVIVGGQNSIIAWFENTMPICSTPVTSDAGTDQAICSGTVVSLNGSVTNAPSSTWTTNGDGTFGNASLPATTYAPGPTDISNGTVMLTLTANDPDGAGPCVAVASSITVTIELAATVTAGIAVSICNGDVANLTGSFGGSATIVTWSGGAGAFDNINSLTPIYTPDISEVGIGPVVLSLTTDDPVGICPAVVAITSVTISVQPSANAGANFAICQGAVANLNGSIGGAATTSTWSTSGDGTFDNTALLTAAYTPGLTDISSGSVNLTLTTDDPDGAGSCMAAASSLTLTINQPAIVSAGADVSICPSDLVVLSGTIGGSASNPMWSSSGSGGFDDNTSLTATYAPDANDINSGTVNLTLTVDAAGVCPQVTDQLTVTISQPIVAASLSIQSNVSVISNVDVIAPSTINIGDVITTTIIQNPTKGTTAVLINNSVDYTANNGTVGADSFVYRICNQCGDCSDGTVTIDILNAPPVISNPTVPITTVVGQSVLIPFSTLFSDINDNIDFASIQVVAGPTSSAATSFDSNYDLTVDYTNVNFAGTDALTVEVCDLLGDCTQITLSIEVDGEITAHNGISPNGDGKNDYFNIANIQSIEPQNTVSIYNRWGDKVFEMENYNSTDPDKRFNGESNQGKDLPSGVYFYKILFASGTPELSGYLTLKR